MFRPQSPQAHLIKYVPSQLATSSIAVPPPACAVMVSENTIGCVPELIVKRHSRTESGGHFFTPHLQFSDTYRF